jgi:hypothetical protein
VTRSFLADVIAHGQFDVWLLYPRIVVSNVLLGGRHLAFHSGLRPV